MIPLSLLEKLRGYPGVESVRDATIEVPVFDGVLFHIRKCHEGGIAYANIPISFGLLQQEEEKKITEIVMCIADKAIAALATEEAGK